MNKRAKSLIFTSILASLLLSGCQNNDDPSTNPSSDSSIEEFTVTFKNYDEMDLYVDTVKKGGTATYKGDTPEKPATVMYEYAFSDWDKELTNVTESFSTYAQYKEEARKYVITFQNYDGSILQRTKAEYGSMPNYEGATPTKPSDASAQYSFATWQPALSPVNGDATYTAVFDASYAPSYRTSGLVYQINGYNEYYSVISYFGEETSIAIPQIFDGLPVKGIRSGAFSNNDKLESVFIPKTIEWIEPNVFENCPSLSHLTIGEGNDVYHIDENGDLASIDALLYSLPSHNGFFEVKDEYKSIYDGAFSCSGVSSLTVSSSSFLTLPSIFSLPAEDMPETLKSVIIKNGDEIKDDQFRGCSHIESISLLDEGGGSSVKKVGDRAFKDCVSLKSLAFSDSLERVGEEAFRGCLKLERITFGTTENAALSYIGDDAFLDLPNLETYTDRFYLNYLGNPRSQRLIAYSPLSESLKSVIIPPETKILGQNLFDGCSNLEDFVSYAKLRQVGGGLFKNCSSLNDISFGVNDGNLDDIDILPYDTFIGCTKLLANKTIKDTAADKEIFIYKMESSNTLTVGKNVMGMHINALSPRAGDDLTINFDEENKAFTYVDGILRDARGNICAAKLTNASTDVIASGEYVYRRSFFYQNFRNLRFEEGVKTIGTDAFYNAKTASVSFKMPESLEYIGENAFKNHENSVLKTAVTTFYTGSKLSTIAGSAFYAAHNVNLFTPFKEKQEGWASGFDAMSGAYKLNVYYSNGI